MPAKKTRQKPTSKAQTELTLSATETEAGVAWLNSLGEAEFRDKILAHLFRKMQKAGAIEWFSNIHGRNDKSIDYLVVQNVGLGRRIIGIQAKSTRIVRSEDHSGAIRIQGECISAMTEEFLVQGNKTRVDNVEVWCSSHITSDAEQVFSAPAVPVKIQVKKASEIFTLIETYSPELLEKIPQCALTLYIKEKRNPHSKSLKLLGCELNPKIHFLEPQFSRTNIDSTSSLKNENNVLRKRNPKPIILSDILSLTRHCVVLAPELSGKTYLMEHAEAVIADSEIIPIFLSKSDFSSKPSSVDFLIGQKLKFYSSKDINSLIQNLPLCILVDDIDTISHEWRTFLFSQNPAQIKILATARRLDPPKSVETFHMTGVHLASVTQFLRSLDLKLSDTQPFTDRAHSFIARTLATSGLPSTPFTISVMLAECHNSSQQFNTPTMGRLIERFVDMQLGSHSDNNILVDFETKREFLTKMAGRADYSIPLPAFRRELIKFIRSRSHPHKLEDFLTDLHNSGVFTFTLDAVAWSHPVIKQYYWVKSLVSKGREEPLVKKLRSQYNATLAALVGSQIKNAGNIAEKLVKDIQHIKLPSHEKIAAAANTVRGAIWKSDEDEEAWLDALEKVNTASIARGEALDRALDDNEQQTEETTSVTVDAATIAVLRKRIEPMMRKLADSKLHIAYNLAAMLINARDTKAHIKASTIERIIACNKFLADWFEDFAKTILPDDTEIPFDLKVARVSHLLYITDSMLGDPFFINVFKSLLSKATNPDETVVLLDLVLSCGGDNNDAVLERLKKLNRPDINAAFYYKVATLYFFRFHRDQDRQSLRKLLKGIRNLERAVRLPNVV